MRIWAATRDENKILTEVVLEFPPVLDASGEEWSVIVGELCHGLDLARPVLLKKHQNDLNHFRHTTFFADDFMESVPFKKLTIEIFPDKTKSKER